MITTCRQVLARLPGDPSRYPYRLCEACEEPRGPIPQGIHEKVECEACGTLILDNRAAA